MQPITAEQRLAIIASARLMVAEFDRLDLLERLTLPGGAYANYVTAKVLLQDLDAANVAASVLAQAKTAPALVVVGGPCEPHYVKGWNDAIAGLLPEISTAFTWCRLHGKDLLEAERRLVSLMRSRRRSPPADTVSTFPDDTQ